MRTLVITDLHLNSKVRGLLDAQIGCLSRILEEEDPEEVIIMGDVFMSRKPSPRVLLAFKAFLERFSKSSFYIIRGNHDSETKADDGITALSLYEDPVKVITHTYIDAMRERVFIPHYEHEEYIIDALRKVPTGYQVFGHFGFFGSLNSFGDADFTIGLSEFRNSCMLGHIHRFNTRTVEVSGDVQTLTCLGTPYTTNFTESGKDNYYAIIEDGEVEYKLVNHGPKHISLSYEEIEKYGDVLADTNYFNMVQVYVNKLSDVNNDLIVHDLLGTFPIAHLEVKYKPIFDDNVENYYDPKTSSCSLTEEMYEEYVNNSSVNLSKEDLMRGFSEINDEIKNY
jgi:predicted phosphodiesterase